MKLTRTRESDRCEPAHSILFDDGFDTVGARPQTVNQSFSLRVARHRNGQISISREPRFGTRGNRQAAHQCERDAGFREVDVDLA